jgi:hypothetical protein
MNRPQRGRDAIVTRTSGGFNAAADWTRTRIVHGRGHGADTNCLLPGRSRTGHGLGQEAAYGADILRPNRDYFADTKALSRQGVGRASSKTDR